MVNESQNYQHERDRGAFMVVRQQMKLGNDEMRLILAYLSSRFVERQKWAAHDDAVK
jgi:hypothetical protein